MHAKCAVQLLLVAACQVVVEFGVPKLDTGTKKLRQ
jgi:hypothetical protein